MQAFASRLHRRLCKCRPQAVRLRLKAELLEAFAVAKPPLQGMQSSWRLLQLQSCRVACASELQSPPCKGSGGSIPMLMLLFLRAFCSTHFKSAQMQVYQSGWIWTSDLLYPKQIHYQAMLHSARRLAGVWLDPFLRLHSILSLPLDFPSELTN